MVERINTEISTPKEPTSAQLAAAQVSIYLQSIEVFRDIARRYSPRRLRRNNAGLKMALTDLYFITEHNLPVDPFREKWGERAKKAEELFKESYPNLQQIKQETLTNASELKAHNRTAIGLRAARKLKSLSQEQRKMLLEMAGYKTEELKDVAKKLSVSAGLTTATGIGATVVTGGAIAYEKIDPVINLATITDGKTLSAVIISYVAHYLSTYAVARTNRGILEDPRINNCPNILATSTYFLLRKFFPENEKVQRLGITAGTYIPPLLEEPLALGSLAIPVIGPQIIFARNVSGIAIQIAQVGGNVIWQKIHGEKKLKTLDQP